MYKSMNSFYKHTFPLINMYKTIGPGADLVGVCRGANPLPPPPLPFWDDLRLSNTTGILHWYGDMYDMYSQQFTLYY